MTRRRLVLFAPLAAALLIVATASFALAQDGLGGKLRAGQAVNVPAGETVDGDLYATAGTVTVDGTVEGDLVALGGQIQLNGTVTGDVVMAAGTVNVGGTVEGDVRAAAGQLNLVGEVGEDAAVAGGQLLLGPGASVGEDLILSAGQATISGSVAGGIAGTAGTYQRTGSVGGPDEVTVQADEPAARPSAADRILDALRQFVVVVLLGALLLWIAPAFTTDAAATLRARPLPSLAIGVLGFIGFIVVVIVLVLAIVLLGLLFGVLTLASLVALEGFAGVLALLVTIFTFVVATAFLVDAVVGLSLGMLVSPLPVTYWERLGLLAAGAAVVVILTSLPIIGGWLKLLVVLLGLGTMLLVAWGWWQGRGTRARISAAPPAEVPEAGAAG